MNWIIVLTALSAIGAAAAAGETAWQAYETRKQVVESKKQGEVAKEQFLQSCYDEARPVLVIISSPQTIGVQQGNESYLDWNQQPPVIEVHNVGNGPALNVRSVIYDPEAEAFAQMGPSSVSGDFTWAYLSDEKQKGEREKHWYSWANNVMSQGERGNLQYRLAGVFSPIKFSEANKLIKSKNHTFTYAFNAPRQPLYPPTSGELWCICRITITYNDIFHRKHASMYDLTFRQIWQVVALIDDIENGLDDLVK